MILTGKAILGAVKAEHIVVEPFTEEHLNPASYDLTLGETVRVYRAWVHDCHEPGKVADGSRLYARDEVLDVRQRSETLDFRMPDTGWCLRPGIGYLMHTVERIRTNRYVPVIDGKSSIGRLFVAVHITAGYVDPGFDGQYTLEVTAVHPVRIYPGMRICQVRFHSPEGEIVLYDGHYTRDKAMGPVSSEAPDMFRTPATGHST
jgi:dCTP deaminase